MDSMKRVDVIDADLIAKSKRQRCDWQIRRPKGDRFVFEACGRVERYNIDGHPRCLDHARRTLASFMKHDKETQ